MKIVTIIGARPQFIKASVVSKAISEEPNLTEVIIHTGQHFDENMSDIFFQELNIPRPSYQLDINGSSHGEMTGNMLIEIEKILFKEKPDRVLVYGDTNSTLAGALAAAKLLIPIAHIEAGLRSFNINMPEEINRILTDQISDILYCSTDTAIKNLETEGFPEKNIEILKIGDVMQDSSILFSQRAKKPENLNIDKNFILTTLHRAENTDDPIRLKALVDSLNQLHKELAPVVIPLHPRTQNALQKSNLKLNTIILPPVGYSEMLWMIEHCDMVMTDSGGLQKEAFFFQKPCVTLRGETEWVELIEIGANKLSGVDKNNIIRIANEHIHTKVKDDPTLYGGGKASKKIVQHLITKCKKTAENY